MKKRLLFTLTSLNLGGIQTTLLHLLNSLDYNKYDVDLVILAEGQLLNEIPKGVNIILLNDSNGVNRTSFLYKITKNMCIANVVNRYKNFKSKEYDVAIAFDGFNNYADLIVANVSARKKLIWVHNDFYNMIKFSSIPILYKIMYKIMARKFKYFDNIICVSPTVMDKFNELFPCYSKKTDFLFNIIDDRLIREKSLQKTDVVLDGKYNIVAVGRLCYAKNFELLIKLHKQLIDDGYKVKTYLVGAGPDKSKLTSLIDNYNIKDTLIMLGRRANPYNIIKQADLVISTSRYESFGNSIMEALILGVPVVSTETSGAKDIRDHVAPNNSFSTSINERELYFSIISAYEGKSKNFSKMDVSKYNNNIIKKFLDL